MCCLRRNSSGNEILRENEAGSHQAYVLLCLQKENGAYTDGLKERRNQCQG